MAERRGPGLTFGQLVTLTFGFLLASVVIFVFGLWVGRDLAEQRALRERDVARVPIEAPPPTVARGAAPPPAAVAPAPADAPPAQVVVVTATAVPTRTMTPVPATRTATPRRATPTRRGTTPTAAAAAGSWTVQAYATNDTVRAIMLARTLKAKGYDASTGTTQVGNTTWYTVRVGHFRDRAAAKALENKLRAEEGLEASTVVPE